MKRLLTILFLLITLANTECNAQGTDASWLHNELCVDSEGGPIIGPLYYNIFYFSEDGRFYESGSYTRSRSLTVHEAYSGKYEYDPKERKITLYRDNYKYNPDDYKTKFQTNTPDTIRNKNIYINNIVDTIAKIKFDMVASYGKWHRKKSKFTFAMTANPVLFNIAYINVCTASEKNYSSNHSNLADADIKKVLNILKNASFSEDKNVDRESQEAKADFIFSLKSEQGVTKSLIFIQKDNNQIYVYGNDWMATSSSLYNISDGALARLIEIAEKYIQSK